MDLIAYAVPFFILAMLAELGYGVYRGRNTYRLNDSVSSLSLGVLSQARRFVTLGIGGYVYHLVSEYVSLPQMDTSSWWTWVLAFVLYDFCYYWLHRLGHERTILWAAHVAHHQSEEYNLTTALRQTSTGFLLGWIFYLPLFFLGIPAEVVVTVGSLNLLYQFWVHTEHVPKLGWYEWVFITPSNHRVHHAQNDIYMDRNYGGVFILWDRLFGTFQEELDEEPVIFGIRGPLKSFNPWHALTHVYVDMIQDCWHARRWRDKLRVWVARTGWQPEDVARTYPRHKNDLSTFEKYDPRVPGLVAWYGVFQLVAAVALLAWMQASELGYWAGVACWAVLLATTMTTTFWLEARGADSVIRWEWLRLGGLGILLGLALTGGAGLGLVAVGVGYLLVNLWLLRRLSDAAVESVTEPVIPAHNVNCAASAGEGALGQAVVRQTGVQ
ncbi:sterol desaturase family protein [Seongchinamella unica]|uniref:Sterol desaturase family protein n=1 Tax=Seongchinamella unica TaxID=2547392 RepID=A0A4R5LQA5_9GAMM|nr:sterol desaturase family protein [Seongchinamella unica]TDG12742.1 sterol desaturase family protein [Seongchinamella unica]